ncbi:MAG: prephenate dehydrogenase/arogenate dehydrogenase family protein [Proteobacteria bacterium]|jgi:prephenate dehydrogenase|nr:prephenate dehydrogenase/arogenate dehydrogenase family protein [Pseudomonadota bacterium]
MADVVVVGTGLIGTSCALALRASGFTGRIAGIGRSRANLDAARARGAIDRGYAFEERWASELVGARTVLVAVPIAQNRSVFAALAPALDAASVIIDAGSTKQEVIAAARATLGAHLARFVPSHPVAGSERSGAEAANAGLYVGRQVIVTPLPETDPEALRAAGEFWTACGARIASLDAARHDRIFAAVSHLPHLLAFLLVDEIASRADSAEYLANAGGGFRDFTRIAASSPEMWRDIALANRDALQSEIAVFRQALDALALSISHGDGTAIEALLERAAKVRRTWGESGVGATEGVPAI